MVTEFDALLPKSTTVTLKSGFEVDVVEMNMLQIFNLFDIVISGMGRNGLQLPDFDQEDTESFVAQLLITVIMSVGKAGPEFVKFLKSMVAPHGLINPGGPSKKEVEHNKRLWAYLDAQLANPNKFDTMDLIELIIRNEAEDLQELGKRIARMWAMYKKVAKPTVSPSSADQNTLDNSAEPSTLFNQSTDGQMINVVDLPSEDYDKSSQPFMSQIT